MLSRTFSSLLWCWTSTGFSAVGWPLRDHRAHAHVVRLVACQRRHVVAVGARARRPRLGGSPSSHLPLSTPSRLSLPLDLTLHVVLCHIICQVLLLLLSAYATVNNMLLGVQQHSSDVRSLKIVHHRACGRTLLAFYPRYVLIHHNTHFAAVINLDIPTRAGTQVCR